MADSFTPKQRSEIMSRIRSCGNKTTEIRLIRIFRRYKIVGWRRGSKLPGRPDFVFSRARLVVFVDGDFWHGNRRRFRLPKSNVDYWCAKIRSNQVRDKAVNRALKDLGWRVFRVWESALRDEEAVAAKIRLLID
jgi:DNA mismatch endonuclease (patch repair protein)